MTHEIQDRQEAQDAAAICAALKRVLAEQNISTHEIERRTGISDSNVRRMTSYQEPKPSQIARIERAIGVELGLVYRIAGLVNVADIEHLLLTDDKLHPVLRRSAVAEYHSRVRISAEAADSAIS